MGLIGALSNHEIAASLQRLAARIAGADGAEHTRIDTPRHYRRLRPGTLTTAITAVLTNEDGPKRRCDIHAEVELVLGRRVRLGSIKAALVRGPHFQRVGLGLHRLVRQPPAGTPTDGPPSRLTT